VRFSGRQADPFSKERWQRKVHAAVDDAAARHLQAKAAERQQPGPEVVSKPNELLKLVRACTCGKGRTREVVPSVAAPSRAGSSRGTSDTTGPAVLPARSPHVHCGKLAGFGRPPLATGSAFLLYWRDWPLTKCGISCPTVYDDMTKHARSPPRSDWPWIQMPT
jgi:hypothetical protein